VSAGVQRHLTQTGDIKAPIWSRDGHWVYYTKTRKSGQRGIFRSLASGGGQPEELVLATDATTYVTDVAPGGDLVFQQEGDLWLLPPGGERTPRRLFGSPARESQGQVSGDGRWIAYTSSETGESAVYIAAFPSLAHRWQVSRIGGSGPRWRADGQELFFVSQRSSMVTSVALQPASDGLRIGEIRPLFRATLRSILSEGRPWDVTADGQRFLVNSAAPQSEPLTLVQNWPARLRPALP
jgi:Tol biopolymer transport system component